MTSSIEKTKSNNKSGRCTKVSNSQPAPISGNVINQILYLDTPGNNSRHVDKCCTAGLGNSLNMALFLVSAAVLLSQKSSNNYYVLFCNGVSDIPNIQNSSSTRVNIPNIQGLSDTRVNIDNIKDSSSARVNIPNTQGPRQTRDVGPTLRYFWPTVVVVVNHLRHFSAQKFF